MSKKTKVEIPQLKLTFKVNNLRLTDKQKVFLALALKSDTNINVCQWSGGLDENIHGCLFSPSPFKRK